LMIPFFASLLASLAVYLTTDMGLVVLINLPALLLGKLQNSMLRLPLVGIASTKDGNIGMAVQMSLNEVCLELNCGDFWKWQARPWANVSAVYTPSFALDSCGAVVKGWCQTMSLGSNTVTVRTAEVEV